MCPKPPQLKQIITLSNETLFDGTLLDGTLWGCTIGLLELLALSSASSFLSCSTSANSAAVSRVGDACGEGVDLVDGRS